MSKLVKKSKRSLSVYSQMLDLNIDDFTQIILSEVKDKINIEAKGDTPDKASVERAMMMYQGCDAHLRSEYRRIKSRYNQGLSHFERLEIDSLNFARKELPSKSTEKQIKLAAYEDNDDLYKMRSECEDLEQKMKFVQGMIINAEKTLSCIQSFANLIKFEMGASKV